MARIRIILLFLAAGMTPITAHNDNGDEVVT